MGVSSAHGHPRRRTRGEDWRNEPATTPPQHKAHAYEATLDTSQTQRPPTLHNPSTDTNHLPYTPILRNRLTDAGLSRTGSAPRANCAKRTKHADVSEESIGSHSLTSSTDNEQRQRRASTPHFKNSSA